MDAFLPLLVLLLLGGVVVLVVFLARNSRLRNLEQRLANVEAAVARGIIQQPPPLPTPAIEPIAVPVPPPLPQSVTPAAPLAPPKPPQSLETVIGQRWIGWIAIILIAFAAAFFLKYAFENQWIGELGRVTLGVI